MWGLRADGGRVLLSLLSPLTLMPRCTCVVDSEIYRRRRRGRSGDAFGLMEPPSDSDAVSSRRDTEVWAIGPPNQLVQLSLASLRNR